MYKERDAYTKLFEHFDKDMFFQKGISDIIFIEDNEVSKEWGKLKSSVFENQKVFIRGYGRDAKKTKMYFKLYEFLFGNYKVKKDPSNNSEPTKILNKTTNYSKNKSLKKINIINYQVSHLFGKTKNPLLFTSPWNIAYIPKYLDPFTGHETKGKYSDEFKKIITPSIQARFKKYIDDYNKIVSDIIFKQNLNESIENIRTHFSLTNVEFEKFKEDALTEFSEI